MLLRVSLGGSEPAARCYSVVAVLGSPVEPRASAGIPPEDVPHVDVSGDEVMNTFGFTPGSLPRNTAMLGLQVAVFVALTYVAVKRLVQRH